MTKSKNLTIFNKIVGNTVLTKENTKPIVDIGICCMQELILRIFNDEKENIWFLDPDTAKMYKL